jgi:flagellin
MTRINTNIPALLGINSLDRSNQAMATSLKRLSTGLKINSAADDPAGLIVSEDLRAQLSAVNAGIYNAQRASNVIATAEGALNEVSALLINVRNLAVKAANSGTLSQEEINANQLQVDSAIASITRIANTSKFAGKKLLDGSLAIQTANVSAGALTGVTVYGANLGTASSLTVKMTITQSAQLAQLVYTGTAIASASTIEVAGNTGSEVFSFAVGTKASAMVYAVNQSKPITGVSATAVLSSTLAIGVNLYSRDYGTDQFVSVNTLSGTFATKDSGAVSTNRDTGRDVAGSIGGNTVTGKGNVVNFSTTTMDLQAVVKAGWKGSTSFKILAGGALFQIAPDINAAGQMDIGISSVTAANLGRGDLGYLNSLSTGGGNDLSSGKLETAQKVVNAAISKVSTLRGRLGAFQGNVLNTSINSLRIASENVTAAESMLRDTDFAAETGALTRSQIMVAAGMSVLAAANQSPQSVLRLLG